MYYLCTIGGFYNFIIASIYKLSNSQIVNKWETDDKSRAESSLLELCRDAKEEKKNNVFIK